MATLTVQSESLNVPAAAEAVDYLYQGSTANLERFALYFDSDSGTSHLFYITQQSVGAALKPIVSTTITSR